MQQRRTGRLRQTVTAFVHGADGREGRPVPARRPFVHPKKEQPTDRGGRQEGKSSVAAGSRAPTQARGRAAAQSIVWPWLDSELLQRLSVAWRPPRGHVERVERPLREAAPLFPKPLRFRQPLGDLGERFVSSERRTRQGSVPPWLSSACGPDGSGESRARPSRRPTSRSCPSAPTSGEPRPGRSTLLPSR